jgi:hypothetical protein
MANAYEPARLLDRSVRLETSAEIVVKKVWHRASALKARDLFDIALVIHREAGTLAAAANYLLERRDVLFRRLEQHDAQLRVDFRELDILDYRPTYDHCAATVRQFLRALRPAT